MSKIQELALLEDEVKKCVKCSDLSRCRIKSVFGEGNPDAKLMLIGEGGGQTENERGLPFCGRSGILLNNILKACGWTRQNDVYICNIVRCSPPNNRRPTEQEISNCRPFLEKQIKLVSPQYILCLGSTASNALVGKNVTDARGEVFDFMGAKVYITFHPSYLLRPPDQEKKKALVWQDLKPLRELLNER